MELLRPRHCRAVGPICIYRGMILHIFKSKFGLYLRGRADRTFDSLRRCGVRMSSQRRYCYSAVKCRGCGVVVWFKIDSLVLVSSLCLVLPLLRSRCEGLCVDQLRRIPLFH